MKGSYLNSYTIREIAQINVGRDLVEKSFSKEQTSTHIYPVYSNTIENKGLYGFYDFEEYPANSLTVVGRGAGLGTAFPRAKGFGAIGRLLVLSPKNHDFDVRYLSEYINNKLIIYNESGGIPQLPGESLAKYKVELPPVPEQKAIADLLFTWDEAIEKTERLIRVKEMRFKRLLNDLIYLPTKEGKWKQIGTKSLFKERKEAKRRDLPLLSITNGEGVIPREDTNRKDTSNEDKSKYLRICPGDIGYNTMRMWQGVSALSSLEGIVSPAYTICIPGEKLHPLFVAYLFKMPFMIHRFYRYSQGLTSDTWNLKFPHFSEVKMPLPSIEEQEQIAEPLSAARREIDLLKQLADKYKTQKRGLMQKMLTGEWRVKPEVVKNFEEAK